MKNVVEGLLMVWWFVHPTVFICLLLLEKSICQSQVNVLFWQWHLACWQCQQAAAGASLPLTLALLTTWVAKMKRCLGL